jgi:hypothetical protein
MTSVRGGQQQLRVPMQQNGPLPDDPGLPRHEHQGIFVIEPGDGLLDLFAIEFRLAPALGE